MDPSQLSWITNFIWGIADSYRLSPASRTSHLSLVREAAPPYGDSTDLDPFDDADALEELEEEIVTLAAHIHAATHRFLTLIAEFDCRRGWELGGHRSTAHWLSFSTLSTRGRRGRRFERRGLSPIFPGSAFPWPGGNCPSPNSGP